MATGLYQKFSEKLWALGSELSRLEEGITVSEHTFEEILAGGRLRFTWDGGGGTSDDGPEAESLWYLPSTRNPVYNPEVDAQLWSSYSLLQPAFHMPVFHMPVFDMDMPRTPEVEECVNRAFPVGEVRWEESSTPGHHHVYVDGVLMLKDEYFKVLDELVEALEATGSYWNARPISEPLKRYLKAQRPRGATFVRMAHVKKGTLPRELNPDPVKEFKGLRALIEQESGPLASKWDAEFKVSWSLDEVLDEAKQSASYWSALYGQKWALAPQSGELTKLTDIPPS